MENKEEIKPMALAVGLSEGNWLTRAHGTLNSGFHDSAALDSFPGDGQLKEFKPNSKPRVLEWTPAWAVRLPRPTSRVLLPCPDSRRDLWQRAPAAPDPPPWHTTGASPAAGMAIPGGLISFSGAALPRAPSSLLPRGAWHIHGAIQLISSQLMTWRSARSSGTGGRQMPEMSFRSPRRDRPQPRLWVYGRERFSTGLRERMEPLRRLSAQGWMSPLISNVTFVGH